jgi:hypothetical protein
MKVSDQYVTATRDCCVIYGQVDVPQAQRDAYEIPYQTLFRGNVITKTREFHYLYDPTGRVYDPNTFEPGQQEDAFSLIGRWEPPQERYFLRAKDGSYFGPNSSPVSYNSLEKAQYKAMELDWYFRPVLFLEQKGVR